MKQRPETLNGVPVPYGAPIDELIAQAKGEVPARWVAFVALAHDPSSHARDALREAARSNDSHVRRIAIEALACRAPETDDTFLIVGALRDPDHVVVRTACEAAATLAIREAHDRVVELIVSVDASTREVALCALRQLWQSDDFRPVFRVFQNDPSPEVRKAAAWTLRNYVTADTWRPLFEAWYRDSVHRHRIWACEIAAEYGGPDVAERLKSLTGDQDGLVRRAAENALSAIG